VSQDTNFVICDCNVTFLESDGVLPVSYATESDDKNNFFLLSWSPGCHGGSWGSI
jgi:hypothetical protein